ncbi:hypothetical protein PGT21_016501 [Puccinia graminis f. sp. tritici]|uniref:RING-type domain-containing protein n=1 Tax=Puccinia graminis f. sp. tritici TaxID=56615 RepID=A0A5B0LXP0_PUCGR|nr:hypothetical protein PGT21_016501 [Puccinia graminis f. sp. tritici]
MDYIPDPNALDSPVEFSAGPFTPPGTPPPLPGVSFTPPGTPPSLADGSSTPQGPPPPLAAGSFTPPGTPPPLPEVSFTPPGTPPPPPPPLPPLPPSHFVPIPNPVVFPDDDEPMEGLPVEEAWWPLPPPLPEVSFTPPGTPPPLPPLPPSHFVPIPNPVVFPDDDEPMEGLPVEEAWRPLTDLTKNCQPQIGAVFQTLAPQDQAKMTRFLRKMMEVFLTLFQNRQRDRLDARENSYLLRDLPQIRLILQASEESDAQLLTALIDHWISLIHAFSNARRSQRVQDLLDQMKNPPARSARRAPSECPICMEILSNIRHSNVRAPCHLTHVFHRNCLQEWLEGELNCPMCRAPFALPHRRRQKTLVRLGRHRRAFDLLVLLCWGV